MSRGVRTLLTLLAPPALAAWSVGATGSVRSAVHAPRAAALAAVVDGDGIDIEGAFWADFDAEAKLEAEQLRLEIVGVEFHQGRLSVLVGGAGVDQLQALNAHLSLFIDNRQQDDDVAALPPFLLEVSSPGLSAELRSEQDFEVFKGFEVAVATTELYKKQDSWLGTLVGRDDEFLRLSIKGRPAKIPRELVREVRLPAAKKEAGDPYS